jgi:hypothetical protein
MIAASISAIASCHALRCGEGRSPSQTRADVEEVDPGQLLEFSCGRLGACHPLGISAAALGSVPPRHGGITVSRALALSLTALVLMPRHSSAIEPAAPASIRVSSPP